METGGEAIKNPKKKKSIPAQTRLIITGLVLSTLFIILVAGYATYSIGQNIKSAYRSFGQGLSKTLAIEGVEVTKDIPPLAKYDALRTNAVSVLNSNDDIGILILFVRLKAMKLTKGLSFSLKRAIGITGIKQSIAQKTGIPTTKGGLERKIGHEILKKISK
jgi:hypothetical protein